MRDHPRRRELQWSSIEQYAAGVDFVTASAGVGLRPTIVRELWLGLRPTRSRT